MAEDVLRVLDALKLESPVLVGHSFGGQDLANPAAAHLKLALSGMARWCRQEGNDRNAMD